jgi:hypothetical protein
LHSFNLFIFKSIYPRTNLIARNYAPDARLCITTFPGLNRFQTPQYRNEDIYASPASVGRGCQSHTIHIYVPRLIVFSMSVDMYFQCLLRLISQFTIMRVVCEAAVEERYVIDVLLHMLIPFLFFTVWRHILRFCIRAAIWNSILNGANKIKNMFI